MLFTNIKKFQWVRIINIRLGCFHLGESGKRVGSEKHENKKHPLMRTLAICKRPAYTL